MICSMDKALIEYKKNENKIIKIRDYIINEITKKIPNTKLVGFPKNSQSNAPHIINIVLPFETKSMVEYLG